MMSPAFPTRRSSEFRIQAASTINNYGTLTGNRNLGGGEDVFTNYSSNSWNVRNFSVSGDPAVRDTENVALSDFGSGNDVFTNTASGTVRLLTVEDMTGFTADTTDDTPPTQWLTPGVAEYSPGMAGRSIREAGVEQAQQIGRAWCRERVC